VAGCGGRCACLHGQQLRQDCAGLISILLSILILPFFLFLWSIFRSSTTCLGKDDNEVDSSSEPRLYSSSAFFCNLRVIRFLQRGVVYDFRR
jgi:hypothetical protein